MKLAMVGIIVKDMEKAISFYETLGLIVDKRYGEEYVELQNETVRISLNTEKMIENVYGFKPSMSGERLELAFEMSSVEAINEKVSMLKSSGYTIIREPWLAPWGQYYTLVSDSEGNVLSLFVDELNIQK